MKNLLHMLASLKLAVVLLALLLVGLAAGTIVESAQGAEAAGRLVYYSWWFVALEVVFAINVVASVVTFFPWGKARVGFVTTHSALVLILAGAAASWAFKIEGQIELWEGQSGREIVQEDQRGTVIARAALPFTVKLESFRIDRYPGTMRPSNFRSDVEVTDPGAAPFKAAIWMNHELSHKGWRLFQSSYRMEGGRSATILSVSMDPGQPIVFAGYALLLVGMCTVLGTRISQARAKSQRKAEAIVPKPAGKAAAAAAIAVLALSGAARAAGAETDALRRLPVQHDGRVMPLDTLAREAVWKITGRTSWNGADPVETIAFWTFEPRDAANAAFVDVGGAGVVAASSLPPGTTHASFLQLVGDKGVLHLMEEARHAAEHRQPRQGALAAAEKLEERLLLLQQFLAGEIVRPFPGSDPNARWNTAERAGGAAALAALASGPRLSGWPSRLAVERELLYNSLRPTRVAWIVLLTALVLSIAAWNRPRKALDRLAFAALLAGFGVMTWGLAVRWVVGGRIPAANMYESLLFLGWGVGLFAVVAFAFLRNRLVVLNASAMAALTLALTDLLPIDGFIHPVPPVLAGTPWLAIHVPIIMVSYSVLAVGVVVAHMQVGFTIFAPQRTETIQRMSDFLYWYIQVGSILLIAGILSGSVWAASSWGRYWGWDPKEVWSLVAFVAYVGILHARWDKMLGRFGVAVASIAAFQTILMTYLGVNFVLTTGLHSYGMGDSPVVTWMAIVAAAEAAFLLWGVSAHRRQQRTALAPAPA